MYMNSVSSNNKSSLFSFGNFIVIVNINKNIKRKTKENNWNDNKKTSS